MPQGGKVVDKVEGADAAAVARMVQKHCPQSEASSQKAGSIAPPAAISNGTALHSKAANGGQSLEQRVDQLINKQPIMLFMKVSSSAINADASMPPGSTCSYCQDMTLDYLRSPEHLTAMHADRLPQAGHPVSLGHACVWPEGSLRWQWIKTALALPSAGDT